MKKLIRFEIKQRDFFNSFKFFSVGIFNFFAYFSLKDSIIQEKLDRIFDLSGKLQEPDYQKNSSFSDSRAFFIDENINKFKDLIQEWLELVRYIKSNFSYYSNISMIKIEFDISEIEFSKEELLYQDKDQVLLHKKLLDFNKYKKYIQKKKLI